MIKHIKTNGILYVLLLVLFLALPQVTYAACPGGLVPIHRTLGPICAYVYPTGANLPSGCTDPNDLNSFLCHPELHASYQLINGFYNPNSGWVVLVAGGFLWSGPGVQPSTPAPNVNNRSTNPIDNDVYRTCDAVDSINQGQVPLVLFSGGTNRPATQGELSAPTFAAAVSACNAGTYYGGGSGTNPPTPPPPPPTPPPTGHPPSPPPVVPPPFPPPASTGGGTVISGIVIPANFNPAYVSIITSINSALAKVLSAYNIILPANTYTQGSAVSAQSSNVVHVSVSSLNVRSAPITVAGVVRQLSAGEAFATVGWVVGELVQGTDRWWKTSDGYYVWAGGTAEQP